MSVAGHPIAGSTLTGSNVDSLRGHPIVGSSLLGSDAALQTARGPPTARDSQMDIMRSAVGAFDAPSSPMETQLLESDLHSARGRPAGGSDTYMDTELLSARDRMAVGSSFQSPQRHAETMQSARGLPSSTVSDRMFDSTSGPQSFRPASTGLNTDMLQSAQGRASLMESDLQSAHGGLRDSRETLLGSDISILPRDMMQSATGPSAPASYLGSQVLGTQILGSDVLDTARGQPLDSNFTTQNLQSARGPTAATQGTARADTMQTEGSMQSARAGQGWRPEANILETGRIFFVL